MPEKDYSHRDVLDKLGLKAGQAVQLAEAGGTLEPRLAARVVDKVGRPLADPDEPLDVVLVAASDATDAVTVLSAWRTRIQPAGGIWLLTPKRGRPGYVDQTRLIEAGPLAGMVDNKVCSVSDTTSAMRFVIRRADRSR